MARPDPFTAIDYVIMFCGVVSVVIGTAALYMLWANVLFGN
jgi:hypothetical protein